MYTLNEIYAYYDIHDLRAVMWILILPIRYTVKLPIFYYLFLFLSEEDYYVDDWLGMKCNKRIFAIWKPFIK